MAAASVLRQARIINTVFCLFGLLLSLYSVFVEVKKEADKDYVAFCDIDDLFACSKVFSTKYGKGLGLVGPLLGEDHFMNQPNGVYGTFTYVLLLALSQVKRSWAAKVQLGAAAVVNLTTPYLAYLLLKVIKTVCILCVGTYIVNAVLLVVAYWRVTALSSGSRKRRNGNRRRSNKKD